MEMKVGDTCYVRVKVASRNDAFDHICYAAEMGGMPIPEICLSPDKTQILYLKEAQFKAIEPIIQGGRGMKDSKQERI